MKVKPDCYPCILKQSLEVARVATENDWLHRRCLQAVLEQLSRLDPSLSPAEALSQTIRVAVKTLGAPDPFAHSREQLSTHFQELLPEISQAIADSEQPLITAALASAAANHIDALIFPRVKLRESLVSDVRKAFEAGFAWSQEQRFVDAVKRAKTVLVALDNAGEVLFDLLLVNELKKHDCEVRLLVKSPGLLHDVTRADLPDSSALPIIESGTQHIGTHRAFCSAEVDHAIEEADLVIAKGSANYETLTAHDAELVFLFRVKCQVVAKDLARKVGDVVMVFAD